VNPPLTPRLTVRPTGRSLNTSVRVGLFLAFLATGVLIDIVDPSVVVLAVIAAAWLAVAVAIWVRPRIDVTPEGITARSLMHTHFHPWDGVTAIWMRWWVLSRHEQGHICLLSRRSANGTTDVNMGHLLSEKSRLALVAFMRVHVPDVPVNPSSPWQDRYGDWHASGHASYR
jgi:hypothetical protein